MNTRQDSLTSIKLQPYLDFYMNRYPDSEISPELITVLTSVIENHPDRAIDLAVFKAEAFISEIKKYIDAAKSEATGLILDREMLEIFGCVKENMVRRESFAHCFKVAKLMREYLTVWKETYPDNIIDDETLHFFCYIADTEPKINREQAAIRAAELRNKIAFYLDAANKIEDGRYGNLSMHKIKYYLWVDDQYPNLEINKALRWVADISHSTLYRRVNYYFPPNYPFSSIIFFTHNDGTASLEIWSETWLGAPLLYSLLAIPGSSKGYPQDKAILLEFNLAGTDNEKSMIEKVDMFFSMIETSLLPNDDSIKIFYDCKRAIRQEVKMFYHHYLNKFPGLAYAQLQLPADPEPINKGYSEIGKLMHTMIDEQDYEGLQKMLADGASANTTLWHKSLLRSVARKVCDYEIKMMLGEPTDEQINELFKSHEVNIKFLFRNFYQVLIAKHSGQYHVYWCAARKVITCKPVTEAFDIQFLDSLGERCFRSDGHPRSGHSSAEIKRLRMMILAFVKTSLEYIRKEKAILAIKFANLLMEYGADPKHPYERHDNTLLESLIDDSYHLEDFESTNKELICDLIKLTLYKDKGCSNLTIASCYDNHFLGKLILDGKRSLYQEGNIPPKIHSVTLIQNLMKCTLQITNTLNKHIYLETVARSHFKENQTIVELCKKRFPWKGKMTEYEFTDYIEKKLKPGKDLALIDLLRDAEGKIIAFNIADVILPSAPGETTLHFIQLTASEKMIQEEFKELMSQISLQRIVFLKDSFKEEVLTAYTAASAISYLQTARLSQVYPKHNCLRLNDRERLLSAFFAGRKPVDDCHFESKLHYHADELKSDFDNETVIHCRAYNNRMEKAGCSTLVAFHSTPINLQDISRQIKPRMTEGLSFFSFANKAAILNENACKMKAKL